MKHLGIRLLSLAGFGSALFACSAASTDEISEEPVAEVGEGISAPSTLGTYCSKTSSNGGWTVGAWANQTSDPCSGGATTVKRRGFWSINGWNSAMVRCDGNVYWVSQGNGFSPVTNVMNAANNQSGCIVTVAPREIPIFQTPFDSNPSGLGHATGFDFARGYTINTVALGTGSSSAASMVDHLGRVHSPASEIDGHNGHDWPINAGEPIRAVADGTIVLVQTYNVPAGTCPIAEGLPGYNPNQKEVYIRHTISAPTAGVSEQFISYYAHMSSYGPGITPGMGATTVTKGQVIGFAGTTGCSTGNHLHMTVMRLNNTANALSVSIGSPPTRGAIQAAPAIDPYGWSVSCGNHADCTDPWGHRGFPNGGFSVNLWSGTPPTNPNW